MVGTGLTLVLSFMVGAGAWLIIGSKFRLHAETLRNDQLNILSYTAIAIPLLFIVVLFLVERL